VNRKLIKSLQRIFWIYVRNNFVITSASDVKMLDFPSNWAFVEISRANYSRVGEFRGSDLAAEYLEKVEQGEMGFFAAIGGQMVGSIWATINKTAVPVVVRSCMRLNPNEVLVHDIVTGERYRGKGVGPYMVRELTRTIFSGPSVSKLIIDVSVRNRQSLRVMEKLGLSCGERAIYVSLLGRVLLEKSFAHSGA